MATTPKCNPRRLETAQNFTHKTSSTYPFSELISIATSHACGTTNNLFNTKP